VFNLAASGFVVSQNGVSAPSTFLLATRDGTISGWNPTVNPKSSVIAVDNSASGAVYTGLAYATVNGAPQMYPLTRRTTKSMSSTYNSTW
jgi:hypothetical protein